MLWNLGELGGIWGEPFFTFTSNLPDPPPSSNRCQACLGPPGVSFEVESEGEQVRLRREEEGRTHLQSESEESESGKWENGC